MSDRQSGTGRGSIFLLVTWKQIRSLQSATCKLKKKGRAATEAFHKVQSRKDRTECIGFNG